MPIADLTKVVPRASDAQLDAATDQGGNSFTQGLRSGMTSAGGQLRALAGGVGEALGADQFAKNQYALSLRDQQEAAAQAPAINSFDQVTNAPDFMTGLRRAGSYAAGQLGQAVPMVGAGLAAGGVTALTGGGAVPAFLAATAATTPFTAGGAIEQQQADPEISLRHGAGARLASALAEGGTQAALSNAVPMAFGGKLVGRMAEDAVAKRFVPAALENTLEGVGGNAAAGAASEKVHQTAAGLLNPNRDTSGDDAAMKEAAIGGAVVGAPFAALGTTGAMRGKAPLPGDSTSLSGLAAGARDFVKSKFNLPETTSSAPVDLSTRLTDLKNTLTPEPVTGDDHAVQMGVPTAPAEQHGALFEQADAAAHDKALRTQQRLTDHEYLTPQEKEQATAVDPTTPEGQQQLSALNATAFERQVKAKSATELADTVANTALPEGSTMRSDVQATPKEFYGMFDKPEFDYLAAPAKKGLADALPRIIALAESGTLPDGVMQRLTDTLGADTTSTLEQAHKIVGDQSPAARDKFAGALLKLRENQTQDNDLLTTVREALPDHLIDSVRTPEIKAFVDKMKSFVSEEGMQNMTPNEQKVYKAKLDDAMQGMFGDKYGSVNEAFAKWAEQRAKEQGMQPKDSATVSDETVDKSGPDALAEQELQPEPTRYYGLGRDAENPGLMLHRDAHAEMDPNTESAHERLLRKAESENPDRSVNWISAQDYAREKGIDPDTLNKMTNGQPEKYGMVAAEGMHSNDRITWKDIDSMQLGRMEDGKRAYSADYDSPSRIDTDSAGVILDARRMVREMGKKVPYAEGEYQGSLQRMRRVFEEGVAAVSDHLGEALHVPDDTVITRRNGKDVTYGDLKSLPREGTAETFAPSDTPTADLRRRLDKTQIAMDAIETKMKPLSEREKAGEALAPKDKAALSKARDEWAQHRRTELMLSEAVESRDRAERAQGVKDAAGVSDLTEHDNIHMEQLSGEPAVKQFDETGAPISYATQRRGGPDVAMERMQQRIDTLKSRAKTEAGKAVVERAQKLFDNYRELTSTHQQQLVDGLAKPKLSDVSATVNDLADKYASTLKDKAKNPVQAMKDWVEGVKRGEVDLKRTMDATDPRRIQVATIPLLRELSKLPEPKGGKVDPARENIKAAVDKLNTRVSELLAKSNDSDGTLAYKMLAPHTDELAQIEHQGLEQRATQMLEYLQNPPKDYTSEKAAQMRDWAQRQMEATKGQADNPDIDAARATIRSVLTKANEVLKGDESLGEMQSKGAVGATEIGPAEVARVTDTIKKLLGSSVDLRFEKIGHAGDYTMSDDVAKGLLRVSVHALDPQSVAYHESWHALLDQMRKEGLHDVVRVTDRAAKSADVMDVLRERFKNEPAVLRQIENSSEERSAYMFQLYAAGDKDMARALGAKPKNVITKVFNAVKAAMGIWTNNERALNIMQHFQSGEYAKSIGDRNAITRALVDPGRNKTVDHLNTSLTPLKNLASAFLTVGSERVRDFDNPALNRIVDLTRRRSFDEGADPGYMAARRIESHQRKNAMMQMLHKDAPEAKSADYDAALTAMRLKTTDALTPTQQRIVSVFRKTLDDTFSYMRDAKVPVKDYGFGKDYAPRMWDTAMIASKEPEFRAMIQKYVDAGSLKGDVEGMINRMMGNDGGELMIDTNGAPSNQFIRERVLKAISPEDAEPFMEKNGLRTIGLYLDQAARRAEWSRRFDSFDKETGEHIPNGELTRMMELAKSRHGATPEQLGTAQKYLDGLNGTLGENLSPKARKILANTMIYQNLRLLPLGIFSAAIDANGIMVNGGSVGDAFKAFTRGVKDIKKNFEKMPKNDEAYKFAEDMGVIESVMLHHALGGTTFGLTHASPMMRKANDLMFRFNGMEQWNTSMRVGATQAGVNFITRHADGKATAHSQRFLAELGLRPSDIVKGDDGRALFRAEDLKAAGVPADKAVALSNKMTFALNKWVDGAVLRPDAAIKPIWMNDPHYQLFGHMKQFMFAFQETTLKRVMHEAHYGNYGPTMALASFIPVMLAADATKALIQGGGSVPQWQQNWDLGDYFGSAVQRSGLFGVGQLGVDAYKSLHHGGYGVGAIGGPAVGQLGDILLAAEGARAFQSTAIDAMPANSLWGSWFSGKGGGEAPTQMVSAD